MKASTITQKDYQKLVIANINCSDMETEEWVKDLMYNNPSELVKYCHQVFMEEYGWAIAQHGRQEAIKQWLQGLPSVCTVPFENFSIVQWAENLTESKLTDKDEQNLLYCDVKGYWSRCAQALNVLFNSYVK